MLLPDPETRARRLFDITYALRHKTRLDLRERKREHVDDPAYEIAAEAILGHLVDTCGWKVKAISEEETERRMASHSTGRFIKGEGE